MADFSNLNKEHSYLRPSDAHLDFFVSFKRIKDAPSMFGSVWTYRVKIFCSVPILVFRCQQLGCNILVHLNIQLLQAVDPTHWLDADHLTFMLIISDASKSDQVAGAKIIKISKADSALIRSACLRQNQLSSRTVENLADFIYQLDIKNIWPQQR